jgi:hypothetical protein
MQQTAQTSEPTSDNSIISRRLPTLTFSDRTKNPYADEPGQRELFLIACISCLVFIAVISVFKNYFQAVNDFGDNSAYIAVASAIRHWDFRGLTIKQFWGLPYLMALVSFVSHASDRSALLVISLGSYFISIALAYRLWGGWVAGFFAVVSFDWFQRAFLGGSEPLFLGLLFSSFLMARRNRWISAALLASLSTVVRPLGFFALVGIAIALIARRQYRHLALVILVGSFIGVAYMLPLWQQFNDPLATVHSYQQFHQPGPALFGIPFYAIVKGTLTYSAPWTNLVLTLGWILFVLCGVIAMLTTTRFREFSKSHIVEAVFAVLYLLAIYSYNLPYWARGTFPRFAIPIVPFVLMALLPWLPKSRYLLWPLSIVSPALAACSAIGIIKVVHSIHMHVSG